MIEFGELRQKLALILLHLGPDGAEFCLHQVFQLAAQSPNRVFMSGPHVGDPGV